MNIYLTISISLIILLTALTWFKIEQNFYSRLFVFITIIFLAIYYLGWRLLFSLSFDGFLNGVFSILLILIEIISILSNLFRLKLLLTVKDRSSEADYHSKLLSSLKDSLSVDVFITTYNEPSHILKRTVVGCQSLDYSNKTIYLLDDKSRPDIQELAIQLGCKYISRDNNKYAKAGNLNHALFQTNSDLIAVFDADFIPTTNFLERTVGFFQEKNLSLIQTNQGFYNPDVAAKNLGLEDVLPHETEVAARHYQVLRDGVNNAMCYGSSFVVRRSAIEKIGGFVKESVSEDIFTSICLLAHGYNVIYLDEKLSQGLSPERTSDHISQRQRGARGAIQAFFIDANPLTILGLKLSQRFNYIGGLVYWLSSFLRIYLLFIPLAYIFLNIIPIKIDSSGFLEVFLSYYLANIIIFAWSNRYSQSFLISDMYSVIYCFPIATSIIQEIMNPFSKGFNVTPKGIKEQEYYSLNLSLAYPLIILLLLSIGSLGISIHRISYLKFDFINLLCTLWSFYNIWILTISLLAMRDVTTPEIFELYSQPQKINLIFDNYVLSGITTSLSEKGVRLKIKNNIKDFKTISLNQSVKIRLTDKNLELSGYINLIKSHHNISTVQIIFNDLSLIQYRQLVKILFCHQDIQNLRKTPGEVFSCYLMTRSLLYSVYSNFIRFISVIVRY